MSESAVQGKRSPAYFVHVVIFLLITFGVGFLPPFAQISEVGMRVLGAFLGAIYGWLFIALDWPSLIALLALGVSGYAQSLDELFVSGWSFSAVYQTVLAYLFAEGLSQTSFTQYIADKIMRLKIFRGRPYVLITGLLLAMVIMMYFYCGLVALFLLWSLVGIISEKAGYKKHNKFATLMIPSLVAVYVLTCFVYPFEAGSLVQINFFTQGMSELVPGINVSFAGWMAWWLLFSLVYIVLWVLFAKFVLRLKFPEIAALGEELDALSSGKQEKMTGDQKFGLIVLIGFLCGMLLPVFLPDDLGLTKILSSIGITGMMLLALCVMAAYQKKDGNSFITLQGVSKGIVWNILWLLVATEPLANAFNAEECGIMPSIMSAITPILTNMSPTLFLVAALIILGLVTQVVHNFILMVVFIPLLCPMYAGIGGNPFVMFMGLMIALNMALATPAASYTSALMFGEPTMERKQGYIQGVTHFIFAMVVFFLIGMPLAKICFPFSM